MRGLDDQARVYRQRIYRQVAALHAANINQGFLATLGEPFLALMYRAIDEAPDSILIVEERDERVIGFVSGGVGMGGIYRKMFQRPVGLAVALLPSLLRPARVWRILEILRYVKQRGPHGPEACPVELPSAELLSIAVAAEARGSGVSERLYRQLEARFREAAVGAFKITVGDALAPAHRFYRKMGARPVGRIEVHRGEGSVVYVQGLKE